MIGKSPDGDSIRFLPRTPELLQRLEHAERVRIAADGTVQLRLDGIDAPETHYENRAQPRGVRARSELLAWCGFARVTWDPAHPAHPDGTIVAATPPRRPAAVLSGLVDPNGRPVSLLLVGGDLPADGAEPAVDAALLRRTASAALLGSGAAYLTLYWSTAPPLRALLRELAAQARDAPRGVWARDATAGFTLRSQASIGTDGALILPKLFRRCTDYLRTRRAGETLPAWLRRHEEDGEDDVVIVAGVRRRLSELVHQEHERVGLRGDLLDFVFEEK